MEDELSKKRFAVEKRNGEMEEVHYEEIFNRINKFCYKLNMDFVDVGEISKKVIQGLYKGVTTSELDDLASEICASMNIKHTDYGVLAARISVSSLHKETKSSFREVASDLYNYVNPRNEQHSPLISKKLYEIVERHANKLEATIDYSRDYKLTYFGLKTLQKSYLLKLNGAVHERPQHLLMRVALGIHGDDNELRAAIETYELMSQRWFTHASPTLFNSGTPKPQMSSCFLLTMAEDSIEGIYDTLKQCALISKSAGGIGLSVHQIRAFGSYIAGTNGTSNGLIPMLRVFNNTARYVDQGGNKRPGAFAIYLEPWHADFPAFLELKLNHGADESRARDLFYAVWMPDLFMRRVAANAAWTLMDPAACPGLNQCWGDEFDALYERYEAEGRGIRQLPAQQLWASIVRAQIETGTPYLLYKDACNRRSNHNHLGTIQCSNLCTEIVQYADRDEIAVCNLASLCLGKFVTGSRYATAAGGGRSSILDELNLDTDFDYAALIRVTRVIVRNLNKIIDSNFYPVEEARRSNLRHRPIGIGVQGLADCFAKMGVEWESDSARYLNRRIFATIYWAALRASVELAREAGAAYPSYAGSPLSRGILQPDMWRNESEGGVPRGRPTHPDFEEVHLNSYGGSLDWEGLRRDLARHGARNSLLVAPMPTASTAQILGNNESLEAFTSNMYVRRVLSGEFQVVNRYLLRDLVHLGLWSAEMKNALVSNQGSIQNIGENVASDAGEEGRLVVPARLKRLYKTVWEISQKSVIRLAAERAPFIDQSQSLNVHIAQPNYGKITSMHFYGWKMGLKTGMYYLRTRAAAAPIQFTVDKLQAAAVSTNTKTSAASTSSTTCHVLLENTDKMNKITLSDCADPIRTSGKAEKQNGKLDAQEERNQASNILEKLKDRENKQKSVVAGGGSGHDDDDAAQQLKNQADILCSLANPDACASCSG